MLSLLLLLPFSNACTTRPPAPAPMSKFWLSKCKIEAFCDKENFPGTRYCWDNHVSNKCMWVGIEVGLFATPAGGAQCACGFQLPQQAVTIQVIVITKVKILWTCKIGPDGVEYHKPVLRPDGSVLDFGFAAPTATSGLASRISIAEAVNVAFPNSASSSTVFPFVGSNTMIPDPATIWPPSSTNYHQSQTYPCTGGWKLKLWFFICGRDACPGNFNLNVGAGAVNVPNHGISSINPGNPFVGSVGGDVHFVTLDGVRYTFNAAGDYIYARTTKPDFEVQVRTRMTKKGSVLAAVGVRDFIEDDVIELWWNGTASENMIANGRHVKEILPGSPVDPSKQHVLEFNKISNDVGEKENKFGKFELIRNELTKTISISHKRWGKDFYLEAHYGGKSTFNMKVPAEWKMEGLAGNKNGVKFDDLCYRNKERDGCLKLDAKSDEIHAFGLSWKASPHELLFQRWMSVPMEDLIFKKLEYSKKELDEAGKHCGKDKSCLYDYISTGSEEFAKHTLKDSVSLLFKDIVHVGDELH